VTGQVYHTAEILNVFTDILGRNIVQLRGYLHSSCETAVFRSNAVQSSEYFYTIIYVLPPIGGNFGKYEAYNALRPRRQQLVNKFSLISFEKNITGRATCAINLL
jgi:hypothetical protein